MFTINKGPVCDKNLASQHLQCDRSYMPRYSKRPMGGSHDPAYSLVKLASPAGRPWTWWSPRCRCGQAIQVILCQINIFCHQLPIPKYNGSQRLSTMQKSGEGGSSWCSGQNLPPLPPVGIGLINWSAKKLAYLWLILSDLRRFTQIVLKLKTCKTCVFLIS